MRSDLAAAILLVTAAAGSGCLRGNQSEPCEILADCLCGDLVGAERFECLQGDNRLALPVGVRHFDAGAAGHRRLSENQCLVVIHQLGAECPHGDLRVRPRQPDPTRRCVHDNDCEAVRCDCNGSAAVAVELRECRDGLCMDATEECDRRCLQARMVRGDPCELLRRCRCAPLRDDADLDADGDDQPDLAECLGRLSEPNPGRCLELANRTQPEGGGDLLPTAACPDAPEFIHDPATEPGPDPDPEPGPAPVGEGEGEGEGEGDPGGLPR